MAMPEGGIQLTSHQSLVTCDLNTTFGHRPIYTCGEAATFIPNSSFLIPNSNEAFIHNQRGSTSHGLTLNLEPDNHKRRAFARLFR